MSRIYRRKQLSISDAIKLVEQKSVKNMKLNLTNTKFSFKELGKLCRAIVNNQREEGSLISEICFVACSLNILHIKTLLRVFSGEKNEKLKSKILIQLYGNKEISEALVLSLSNKNENIVFDFSVKRSYLLKRHNSFKNLRIQQEIKKTADEGIVQKRIRELQRIIDLLAMKEKNIKKKVVTYRKKLRASQIKLKSLERKRKRTRSFVEIFNSKNQLLDDLKKMKVEEQKINQKIFNIENFLIRQKKNIRSFKKQFKKIPTKKEVDIEKNKILKKYRKKEEARRKIDEYSKKIQKEAMSNNDVQRKIYSVQKIIEKAEGDIKKLIDLRDVYSNNLISTQKKISLLEDDEGVEKNEGESNMDGEQLSKLISEKLDEVNNLKLKVKEFENQFDKIRKEKEEKLDEKRKLDLRSPKNSSALNSSALKKNYHGSIFDFAKKIQQRKREEMNREKSHSLPPQKGKIIVVGEGPKKKADTLTCPDEVENKKEFFRKKYESEVLEEELGIKPRFSEPIKLDFSVQKTISKCVALFDFKGRNKDELSFKKGDLISIYRLNDDEWFEGSIVNGKGDIQIGMFPSNYTDYGKKRRRRRLKSASPFRIKKLVRSKKRAVDDSVIRKKDEIVKKLEFGEKEKEGSGEKEGKKEIIIKESEEIKKKTKIIKDNDTEKEENNNWIKEIAKDQEKELKRRNEEETNKIKNEEEEKYVKEEIEKREIRKDKQDEEKDGIEKKKQRNAKRKEFKEKLDGEDKENETLSKEIERKNKEEMEKKRNEEKKRRLEEKERKKIEGKISFDEKIRRFEGKIMELETKRKLKEERKQKGVGKKNEQKIRKGVNLEEEKKRKQDDEIRKEEESIKEERERKMNLEKEQKQKNEEKEEKKDEQKNGYWEEERKRKLDEQFKREKERREEERERKRKEREERRGKKITIKGEKEKEDEKLEEKRKESEKEFDERMEVREKEKKKLVIEEVKEEENKKTEIKVEKEEKNSKIVEKKRIREEEEKLEIKIESEEQQKRKEKEYIEDKMKEKVKFKEEEKMEGKNENKSGIEGNLRTLKETSNEKKEELEKEELKLEDKIKHLIEQVKQNEEKNNEKMEIKDVSVKKGNEIDVDKNIKVKKEHEIEVNELRKGDLIEMKQNEKKINKKTQKEEIVKKENDFDDNGLKEERKSESFDQMKQKNDEKTEKKKGNEIDSDKKNRKGGYKMKQNENIKKEENVEIGSDKNNDLRKTVFQMNQNEETHKKSEKKEEIVKKKNEYDINNNDLKNDQKKKAFNQMELNNEKMNQKKNDEMEKGNVGKNNELTRAIFQIKQNKEKNDEKKLTVKGIEVKSNPVFVSSPVSDYIEEFEKFSTEQQVGEPKTTRSEFETIKIETSKKNEVKKYPVFVSPVDDQDSDFETKKKEFDQKNEVKKYPAFVSSPVLDQHNEFETKKKEDKRNEVKKNPVFVSPIVERSNKFETKKKETGNITKEMSPKTEPTLNVTTQNGKLIQKEVELIVDIQKRTEKFDKFIVEKKKIIQELNQKKIPHKIINNIINNDIFSLKKLNLSNYIPLSYIPVIVSAFLENTTLIECLFLNNLQINDEDIVIIMKSIKKNTKIKLKEIYLKNNKITDVGAKSIGKMLQKNESLQKIDIRFNFVKEKGIISIFNGILNNNKSKLREFISSTIIICDFSKILPNKQKLVNSSLKIFRLYNTNVKKLISLYSHLLLFKNLISLSFNKCNISNEELNSVCEWIIGQKSLKFLDLSFNKISDIKKLVECAGRSKSLKFVDLKGNLFGDNGIVEISKNCENFFQRKYVEFNSNGLTDNCVDVLAELFEKKKVFDVRIPDNQFKNEKNEIGKIFGIKSIQTIDLSKNNFGDKNSMKMINELSNNNNLSRIFIGSIGITDEIDISFFQSLLNGKRITHLSLCDNQIKDRGVTLLCKSMVENKENLKKLCELNLSGTLLKKEGICSLGNCLNQINIENVYLSRNELKDDDITFISENNKNIRKIFLCNNNGITVNSLKKIIKNEIKSGVSDQKVKFVLSYLNPNEIDEEFVECFCESNSLIKIFSTRNLEFKFELQKKIADKFKRYGVKNFINENNQLIVKNMGINFDTLNKYVSCWMKQKNIIRKITKLDISQNPLTDKSAEILSKLIFECKNLEFLVMNNVEFSEKGLEVVFKGVLDFKKLKSISVCSNSFLPFTIKKECSPEISNIINIV